MNLKSFIIASVIIHLIAGLAVYFHYNPIVLNSKPNPVEEVKPEKESKEGEEQELLEQTSFSKPTPVKEIKPEKESMGEKKVLKQKTFSKPNPVEEVKPEKESKERGKQELSEQKDFSKKESTKRNFKKNIKDFSDLKQKPGKPPLSYPDFARRLNMQGTVSLLFFVDERGLVEKMQLETSSGYADLDNFVIRVLARYQFLENQSAWVRHKKTFVLEGEKQEYLRLRRENREKSAEENVSSKERAKSTFLPGEEEGLEAPEEEMELIEYEGLEGPKKDLEN